VLAYLKQRGLEKNTLVIFASDNGGYIGVDKRSGQTAPVTSNTPLRSGKGSLYEGGIRVPLIVRWPGITPAGAECHNPVVLMDLFYTIRAAGKTVSEPLAVGDGIDLTPLLKNPTSKLDRDTLFFHYPHYYETTTPVSAIRSAEWKLLEYLEDGRVELFNLNTDPSEQTDLAASDSRRAAVLRERLDQWRRAVGARMPTPNPAFAAKN